MNRILLGIFAVGLLFVVGQALECYKCDFGLGKLCITSKITCKEGELCFKGKGEAASFIPITLKGCLKADECDKVTEVSHEIVGNQSVYSMNRTCCDQDLCNSAPNLPVPTLLPLTMATLSASLLMSQTLV